MKHCLILLFSLFLALPSLAQKKGSGLLLADLDSLVNVKYISFEPKRKALTAQYDTQTDSLKKIKIIAQWNELEGKCNEEIFNIYGSNFGVQGVVSRIYALRNMVDKKQLSKIYDKLPDDVKNSDPYAASLKYHIDIRQVEVGDTIGDFKAKMVRDSDFSFGELSSMKNVLLIFGGLDCMGENMKNVLKVMYRQVDLSKMEIVSVFMNPDKESFEQDVRNAGINWLSICDFKGDHSPLKIAFGVQATPTCVYISKGGSVELITVGVTPDILAKMSTNNYANTATK